MIWGLAAVFKNVVIRIYLLYWPSFQQFTRHLGGYEGLFWIMICQLGYAALCENPWFQFAVVTEVLTQLIYYNGGAQHLNALRSYEAI